jgi:hypothetical protein
LTTSEAIEVSAMARLAPAGPPEGELRSYSSQPDGDAAPALQLLN